MPRQDAQATSAAAHASGKPSSGLERALLARLHHLAGAPPARLVLWDGYATGPETARFAIEILDRGALYRLLRSPNIGFGDLYSAGRLRVRGDLSDLLVDIYRHFERMRRAWPPWLAALWRDPPRDGADLDGARDNIHRHYDLGNGFYRQWLDTAAMQYTCAYFETPDMTLEQAQLAKLEHVCRKLRLQPGQQVIEAGCGWGGLARYMAKNYGVKVQAYNISSEQIAYARQRAGEEGLAGQVEYVEDDYRHISGRYDAFVAVGMLEHVGPDHYQELGQLIDRSLTEDGLGLIHTIGQNRAAPLSPWFLQRIFPGSYPPTLREMMALFEPCDFSVLDVENLRLHYAKTCEHWLSRFEANQERVRELFDEAFVRTWRLYLSGCIANFQLGNLQLYQVVFARSGNNRIPLTRSHLTVP